MMLDLMLANANGRTLSASDLATGAGVPLSSGLRMIAAIEAAGLAKRSIDERDRRRTIVRLTEAGAEKMASYFEKAGSAMRS
ncbi:winged helix DNA-binding protein, partial [Streptococcus suis]